MNHHYDDIRSRINESPKWWDEAAVPRYCDFAPYEVANIYAIEVVLLGIACQDCGHPFRVAMSFSRYEQFVKPLADGTEGEGLSAKTVQFLHYGDPPNVGCCAAGPTMNSVPRRVLECWRQVNFDWQRVPELEVEIDCEWAKP